MFPLNIRAKYSNYATNEEAKPWNTRKSTVSARCSVTNSPWAVASDFADELKSRTSGYATFDYELAGWQFADICRLDVLVNGEVVDAMATLCHRSKAVDIGKKMVKKVKEALPRQMFEVAVQASLSGKIIARETVSAMRKNVLAKCYGGDVSRKKKLLQKQKDGKKRMRRMGNVDIPADAFAGLLSAK